MKQKPMLFHKLNMQRQGKGREVIGLIGTHHGTGVTYTGLMLAFYLAEELGKRTAFLECNDHHDMRLIQEAYEWSTEEAYSFSYNQVTCYKEVHPNRISDIYGEDFDCLILDLGTDFHRNREELQRCSTKIVVGGRSEWDFMKLIKFLENCKTYNGSDSWLYFIPQADEKTVKRISKELDRKVWSVPAAQDPVLPSKNVNYFFSKIF